MKSRRTYECFACKRNGFPDTQVYLSGKDEEGRTIQLEEDGTRHIHNGRSSSNGTQQPQQQQSKEEGGEAGQAQIIPLLKIISAQLEKIGVLLEEERKERRNA